MYRNREKLLSDILNSIKLNIQMIDPYFKFCNSDDLENQILELLSTLSTMTAYSQLDLEATRREIANLRRKK